MKTKKLFGRVALIAGLAIAPASSISAQTLAFSPFETQGVSNNNLADLEYIKINALIIKTADGLKITISNDSIPGQGSNTLDRPTVTSIFFEDNGNYLNGSPSIWDQSMGVVFEENNATLPGGNNINFKVESSFTAVPPPVENGLDPGQFVTFYFAGLQGHQILDTAGSIRIGVHVQQIGATGADSASFVTSVPEPSAALLGAIGTLFLLRRRR